MGRIVLKNGTAVAGDQAYIIDGVAGEGANCIVYSAHYSDNAGYSHAVLLKECYPYASNITRIGDALSWADNAERGRDLAAFEDAYKKLMQAQNSEKNRNSTVVAFQIFNANGTVYSVVHKDVGTTYDKETGKSLLDNLETVLALTKAVKNYHDNGYLHLDIKPSNFLVIPETRQLVKLFDLDTVIPKKEVATAQCIPYSENWAPPEQLQGQRDKICEATDLYAIGAILFEKVMGRKVEQQDCGSFADWSFDEACLDGVNPEVKRLLRTIFRNTLSVNPKRRYQRAGELITILEELVVSAAKKMYLISNCPAARTLFIGRAKELEEIEDAFARGKKCVVVQGFMGMGKSSLAIQYAAKHRAGYDAICFSKVYDSLSGGENNPDVCIKNGLSRCVINGATQEETADQRESEFKKLVSKNTLIIIDNYDVERITPYVEELLALNCRILITTRTIFRNLGSDIHSLYLSGLEQHQLLKLFEIESGNQYQDTEKLFGFFEAQQNLTYSIILGAGQIRESCISLDEYLDDIYAQNNNEAVFYNNEEDQLLNHYRRTIRLHLLSDEQKEVLRTVFVMSYAINDGTKFVDSKNGIFDRAVFKAYTGMNLNPLNVLIRSRIVSEDEDGTLSLHPSIQEIVKEDLKPNCQNCPCLYENIRSRLNFICIQRDGFEVEIVDADGNYHFDVEERAHELFDIYVWLYESDPEKEKHLYNLFAALTIIDFDDCFMKTAYEEPIWHLDWVNREYFIARLRECSQTECYRKMFVDENYMEGYCPNYGIEHRARLSFIRICCATIKYLGYPYYTDYRQTFIELLMALVSIKASVINDTKELSQESLEFVGDILEAIAPIFKNCCPIDMDGNYSSCIEQAQYNCVAEGYELEEYPFTVGLNAYNSLWTYMLYKITNRLLIRWISTATKLYKTDPLIKDRKAWQREISVELHRIDRGFDQFFDFYGETPHYYSGTNNVDEGHIMLNEEYVNNGFDKCPDEYVTQILNSLKKAKHPLYLYSLLLNKDFPLTNIAYDLLFDHNIGEIIATDVRLSNNQKFKLLQKALYEYIAFHDDWNTSDPKREVSTRQYCMNDDLRLDITEDSYNAVEINNHIVVIWYQIIRELLPGLKLSKQFLLEITKAVQTKYIESSCQVFDLELYSSFKDTLLKDIPEFGNHIEIALYELVLEQGHTTKCDESILANAIHSFFNGRKSAYRTDQIVKAKKHYVDAKGEKYIPVEYELLNLLVQL